MMSSSGTVSGVGEVASAVFRLEAVEEVADAPPGGLHGALGGLAKEVLQLREDLLNRVQVGAVGREVEEFRARRAERGPDGGTFVAPEVVHDNDVAAREGGRERVGARTRST